MLHEDIGNDNTDIEVIMPVGVVRSEEDEIAWERAKAAARRQYPDVHGARFYRIVMAIYKKMAHYQPKKDAERFE